MSAMDSDVAHRAPREREIDLLALCTNEDWYPWVPKDSAGTFYHQLVEGPIPPWLRSIPLPEAPGNYRLFEVLDIPPGSEEE